MSNTNKKKFYGYPPAFVAFLAVLTVFALNGLIGLLTGRGVEKAVTPPATSTSQSATPAPEPTPEADPRPVKPAPNDYTVLVNTAHPLQSNYSVETRAIKGTEKLFDVRVADTFEKMLDDARRAGYPLMVVSTYRTIAYQQGLYNRKVKEYLNKGYTQAAAEEEAAKWVAIPGTSEHNTGLVADIVSTDWYNTNSDLEQTFENTPHFTWLIQHCADYGFILRYPKGKEAVTGIVYEPWHYRYVGVDVAHYIMDNNLTLEEYWEE